MACHQAKRLIDDMWDEMTTILHEAARDVAAAKLEADDIVNKSTEALSKVVIAECSYHHAKALATHKKHAKQLSLQQRDFDVVVKDMKRTSQCKAMRAKKDFDVIVKDMKRTSQHKAMSAKKDFDVLVHNIKRTSKRIAKRADVVLEQQATTIKTLEAKVALAELSVEFMHHQLENEHKEAMSDLIIAQRSKVRDLQFCHVTNLA